MRIEGALRSSVIAGLVAAVIWAVIDAVTGDDASGVLVGAVMLGLATFAISFAISRLVAARRGPSPR